MENTVLYNMTFLDDIYPYFIDKYLNTDILGKLRSVSYFNNSECEYTMYDHSRNVAHMMWHFTHDVNKTVFALLHELSSSDIIYSRELEFCLTKDNVDVRGFNDFIILSTIINVDEILSSSYFIAKKYDASDIRKVFYSMNIDDGNKISFSDGESADLFTSMVKDYTLDENVYARKRIK